MKGLIIMQSIKSSACFEKAVLSFFPRKMPDYLFLESFRMFITGTGHYKLELTLSYNGEILEIKENTTNSELWDWYQDVEEHNREYQNWFKRKVLRLLEDNKDSDEFVEFLNDIQL